MAKHPGISTDHPQSLEIATMTAYNS